MSVCGPVYPPTLSQVPTLQLQVSHMFCFIISSEIDAYQKQIKVISITSEMIWYQLLVIDISLYFH